MANEENLKPFKTGNDERRNLNGAPSVPHSRTRLLKILTLLQKKKNEITGEEIEMTVAEQMDMKQIVKAIEGDTKAYKVVIDRLEGKAPESIKHSIEQNNRLHIHTIYDGEEITLHEKLKDNPSNPTDENDMIEEKNNRCAIMNKIIINDEWIDVKIIFQSLPEESVAIIKSTIWQELLKSKNKT